jgi:coproporphyrinogen III oxidase-like Fe-S oxidoreductase
MIFQFIKADKFFPAYCPQIKNYKRKVSGRNGRGNPVEFSEQELKDIRKGIKRMAADLTALKEISKEKDKEKIKETL